MKTYKTHCIKQVLAPTVKKLSKKFSNKLQFLRSCWSDIAPEWTLDAWPYLIKNNTVIFKSKKNPLILQYREKELLKIVRLILDDSITKVKVFSK